MRASSTSSFAALLRMKLGYCAATIRNKRRFVVAFRHKRRRERHGVACAVPQAAAANGKGSSAKRKRNLFKKFISLYFVYHFTSSNDIENN